jgi:hypothetical protein
MTTANTTHPFPAMNDFGFRFTDEAAAAHARSSARNNSTADFLLHVATTRQLARAMQALRRRGW